MIKVINIESKTKTPVAEGHVRNILGPSDDATRVRVAVEDVDLEKTCRIAAATTVFWPLGTCASAFLMKWTRQRCQVAPTTRVMAALTGGVNAG